jgi:hypothetical protein
VARRARTAGGLLTVLVVLAVVAAAVTALPPAAGAAAPLPHRSRPHLPSSAADSRSPRHAFRATANYSGEVLLLLVTARPARGTWANLCGLEVASGPAVAGGDPVNGSDPSGLKGGAHPPGIECGKYGYGSAGWNHCVYQLLHPDYSYIGNGCWGTTSWWNCFVMEVDPAYGILSGIHNAIEAAQNPCESNWAIAGYAAEALLGLAGSAAIGTGVAGVLSGAGVLPAGVTATADVAKFNAYAFVTDKSPVFGSYGYTVEDSQELANLYAQQAAQKFAAGDYTLGKLDQYGQRITIQIDLPGIGAAAGRSTVLNSGWMIESSRSIRLLTPFAGFGQ